MDHFLPLKYQTFNFQIFQKLFSFEFEGNLAQEKSVFIIFLVGSE